MKYPLLLLCCLCWLLLTSCGLPLEVEQDESSFGGATPEEATEAFFGNLNEALKDPTLTQIETRRMWAERMASYFAPSERVDQRGVLQRMLANFAEGFEQLPPDQLVTLEVDYTLIQVVDQNDEEAMVRLIDGVVRFRRMQVLENGYRQILVDQQRPLNQTLGLRQGVLPLIQVNGRWFLTER